MVFSMVLLYYWNTEISVTIIYWSQIWPNLTDSMISEMAWKCIIKITPGQSELVTRYLRDYWYLDV